MSVVVGEVRGRREEELECGMDIWRDGAKVSEDGGDIWLAGCPVHRLGCITRVSFSSNPNGEMDQAHPLALQAFFRERNPIHLRRQFIRFLPAVVKSLVLNSCESSRVNSTLRLAMCRTISAKCSKDGEMRLIPSSATWVIGTRNGLGCRTFGVNWCNWNMESRRPRCWSMAGSPAAARSSGGKGRPGGKRGAGQVIAKEPRYS